MDLSRQKPILDQASQGLDCYLELRQILIKKISSINKFQVLYLLVSLIPIVILFFFNDQNQYLVLFKNVILTFVFIYFAIYLYFSKTIETKQLNAVLDTVIALIEEVTKQR